MRLELRAVSGVRGQAPRIGPIDRRTSDRPGGHLLPQHRNRMMRGGVWPMLALMLVASGCGSKLVDAPPRTIEPARAAVSPPPATAPGARRPERPRRGRRRQTRAHRAVDENVTILSFLTDEIR